MAADGIRSARPELPPDSKTTADLELAGRVMNSSLADMMLYRRYAFIASIAMFVCSILIYALLEVERRTTVANQRLQLTGDARDGE